MNAVNSAALAQPELLTALAERLDAASRRRLDAERERLAAWLGDVRIRPRFATPLGKELAARSGAPRSASR